MSPAKRGSLGFLLGILLLVVAIWLSRPEAADVSFNIEAASFDIPAHLTLSLYRGGQFELKNFSCYGFTGNLAFRAAAKVHTSEKRSLAPNATTIGLAMGEVQPYLKGSREGGVKEITLDVGPPALVEGALMGAMPGLRVTSRRQEDAKLTVDSGSIAIGKGAYYVISEISPKDLPEFSGVFSGTPESTDRTARLVLESSRSPNTYAELYFLNKAREMRLVDNLKLPNPIALSFHNATYASILIYGDSAADANLIRPTSVDMEIKNGTIEVLDLLPADDDHNVKLRIKGTAEAISVREGSKELRPTALADLMRDPWASRNRWLMFWCVVAAIGLKLINHVLGVVLKKLVGD